LLLSGENHHPWPSSTIASKQIWFNQDI